MTSINLNVTDGMSWDAARTAVGNDYTDELYDGFLQGSKDSDGRIDANSLKNGTTITVDSGMTLNEIAYAARAFAFNHGGATYKAGENDIGLLVAALQNGNSSGALADGVLQAGETLDLNTLFSTIYA